MGDCFRPNRKLQVSTRTVSVKGDTTSTWSSDTTYWGELIYAGSVEKIEEGGGEHLETRKYKVRNETAWARANTRFKEADDTNYFYVDGFYPYKGSRKIYLLVGVQRGE